MRYRIGGVGVGCISLVPDSVTDFSKWGTSVSCCNVGGVLDNGHPGPMLYDTGDGSKVKFGSGVVPIEAFARRGKALAWWSCHVEMYRVLWRGFHPGVPQDKGPGVIIGKKLSSVWGDVGCPDLVCVDGQYGGGIRTLRSPCRRSLWHSVVLVVVQWVVFLVCCP